MYKNRPIVLLVLVALLAATLAKAEEQSDLERFLKESQVASPQEWNVFQRELREEYANDENPDLLEDDYDDDPSGRMLQQANSTVCKFKLKKLAQFTLNYKYNYDVQRDNRRPRWSYGKGPLRYRRNNIPQDLQPKCGGPKKSWALSFFLPGVPKNHKFVTAGCTAHQNTNWVQFPAIAMFDCHGNQVNCVDGDMMTVTTTESKRGYLLILTPPDNRRPIGYKFFMKKQHRSSLWCDYYPF